jgi:hypothetical protein
MIQLPRQISILLVKYRFVTKGYLFNWPYAEIPNLPSKGGV